MSSHANALDENMKKSTPNLLSQVPVQQGSTSNVSGVPSTSVTMFSPIGNHDKTTQIQQQFILLFHAHKCQMRENHVNGGIQQCTLPHCRTMKNVLHHMTTCREGGSCSVPYCSTSREILSHWNQCTNRSSCSLCSLLTQTPDQRQYEAAAVQQTPPSYPAPANAQREYPVLDVGSSSVTVTAPIDNPEQAKLIWQRLMPLVHARDCQWQGNRQCTLPDCHVMKNVLNHIKKCQAGRSCSFPHCLSSRQILCHWNNCTNRNTCLMCSPIVQASDRRQQESVNDLQPAQCLPQALNHEQAQTLLQHHHQWPQQCEVSSRPVSPSATGMPQQLQQNPFTNTGANQSSFAESEVGVQDSLHGTSNCVSRVGQGVTPQNSSCAKDWHQNITKELRHHLVQKIIRAIFPPINHVTLQDKRVLYLTTYARKLEGDMYKMANSQEEYFELLAKEIYQIGKEVEEKRQKRQEQRHQIGSNISPVVGNTPGTHTSECFVPCTGSQAPSIPQYHIQQQQYQIPQFQPPEEVCSAPWSSEPLRYMEDSNDEFKSLMSQLSQETTVSSVEQTDLWQPDLSALSSFVHDFDRSDGKAFTFSSQKTNDSRDEKIDVDKDETKTKLKYEWEGKIKQISKDEKLQPKKNDGQTECMSGIKDDKSSCSASVNFSVVKQEQSASKLSSQTTKLCSFPSSVSVAPSSVGTTAPTADFKTTNSSIDQQLALLLDAHKCDDCSLQLVQFAPKPSVQNVNQSESPSYVGIDSSISKDACLCKSMQIQNHLALLLHVKKCQKLESRAVGKVWECALGDICLNMRSVRKHLASCQESWSCKVPYCLSSRQILLHYKICSQDACRVCLPLRNAVIYNESRVPFRSMTRKTISLRRSLLGRILQSVKKEAIV